MDRYGPACFYCFISSFFFLSQNMIDVFIVPVCEKKNDVEKVIKDFYRLIE